VSSQSTTNGSSVVFQLGKQLQSTLLVTTCARWDRVSPMVEYTHSFLYSLEFDSHFNTLEFLNISSYYRAVAMQQSHPGERKSFRKTDRDERSLFRVSRGHYCRGRSRVALT